MTKKVRKMKPYTAAWQRAANQLARDAAPTIYPCKKCGAPVLEGYCCTHCGTNKPR